MIRLLLADDEALIRAGLRMILEAEDDLEVVGEAANGREALEVAGRERPDGDLDGRADARDERHRGNAAAL